MDCCWRNHLAICFLAVISKTRSMAWYNIWQDAYLYIHMKLFIWYNTCFVSSLHTVTVWSQLGLTLFAKSWHGWCQQNCFICLCFLLPGINSDARKYKANFLDVCDFPHLKKKVEKKIWVFCLKTKRRLGSQKCWPCVWQGKGGRLVSRSVLKTKEKIKLLQ